MGDSKIAVIIPAAGKGERFGGDGNKTFAKLDGRAIFLRTLELFINRDDVCQTIMVVSGADLEEVRSKYSANLGLMGVTLVEGGAARAESVRAGLEKVSDDADYVAIHDAVRPCVTKTMIDDVFAEGAKSGAAILAAPLYGTIKRVSEAGVIDATVPRAGLFEAQTPQVFKRTTLLEIYANPPEDAAKVTDEAELFERAGHAVTVVCSDATNIKITTKSDLTLAKAINKSRPPDKPSRPFGAFEEAQW